MKEFTITDDFPSNQATFDLRFNTEEACHEYLFKLRWAQWLHLYMQPFLLLEKQSRACTQCEHQHSITAGSIMEGTRKPLVSWFNVRAGLVMP